MSFLLIVRNTRARDNYSRGIAREECCYDAGRVRVAWARAAIADVNDVDRYASLRLPSVSKAVPASGIVIDASAITRPDIVTSVSQSDAWA
jgi:hypothetical protein